jgi:hypothetical protein
VHAAAGVIPRPGVLRGHAAPEHVVQLFEDIESRAEAVAGFLHQGWVRGNSLLVAARPDTWSLVSYRLIERGCALEEAIASGRLALLDAGTTLSAIVRNGYLVPERFGSIIAPVVARLCGRSRRPVQAYGELVDVLAGQGELGAAKRLEELWNGLRTKYPLALLCGYTAGHFGDPQTATSLRHICEQHDRVVTHPDDLLATWLVDQRPTSEAGRKPETVQ